MDCQNVKKSTSADRVAVFQDTQNWCETDPDLIAYIQKAKKATEIFYEDNYPADLLKQQCGYIKKNREVKLQL